MRDPADRREPGNQDIILRFKTGWCDLGPRRRDRCGVFGCVQRGHRVFVCVCAGVLVCVGVWWSGAVITVWIF